MKTIIPYIMNKIINKSFESLQKVVAVVLCVMLAGSFYSCGKKSEYDIEQFLLYQMCECDREIQPAKKFEEENILLLYAEKVTYDEILDMSRNSNGKFKYIICDFSQKTAVYSLPHGDLSSPWSQIHTICNFPFDYSWEIPKSGLYVSFSADSFYPSCHGWSPNPETFYTDFVLISLKIQTK